MHNYKDIDKILDISKDSIRNVQKEFNTYQNAHFPTRSPEFFCLELNGEAGELANIEKKRWKGKTIPDERFADEAADVLIALLNYSNARGVDLGKAVSEKLAKIERKRIELNSEGEEY